MLDIEQYSKSDFERAKQHTDEGVEFWYARDLQGILEYGQWRNFLKVVEKAKESCKKRDLVSVVHDKKEVAWILNYQTTLV